MVDSQKPQVSPFNDGIGTLQRIGLWWQTSNEAAYQMNFYDRFNALDRVYEELYAWATPEEIIILENERAVILSQIPTAFISDGMTVLLSQAMINALDNYAKKLRILWHRAQLDMKSADFNSHELDEMM